MTTTLEVLRDARELLSEPEKWCRIMLHDLRTGRSCLLGAVMRSANDAPCDYHPAMHAVEAAMPSGYLGIGIAEFNDDPSTSHADVLAVLDRAIAKEEKNDE